MKTKKLLIIVLFLANVSIAQVGIGNTSPEAILDITASNVVAPSANDGILIPRIDDFPAINPTALQDGMMVFVTGNGTPSKGFYYWDNATSAWLLVGGAKAINDLSDGKSDTDGTNDGSSIFLGINAGANDDGSNNRNIGIGWEALISNTTGNDNVAIGNNTLNSNISGFSNIGIGREVLYNNLGNGNIGIGFHALFGNTTGNDNMAIGFDAMSSNTTGISNTAMGSQALRLNTIGTRNNAYGRYALENNTDGIDNTATGYMALRNNTSGNENTAIGNYSLINNTTGFGNSALGINTLAGNTTGESNVAIGRTALYSNTTGSSNVGIGRSSLFTNTTGAYNIGIGRNALLSLNGGFSNVAVGFESMYNTTGSANIGIGFHTLFTNTTGNDNVAIGYDTMYLNTTGNQNTAVGSYSLRSNTTGFFNNAFGRFSMENNTTGAGNTALGFESLRNNTTGNDNTSIGNGSGVNINGSNNVFLGFQAGSSTTSNTNSGNIIIGYQAGRNTVYNNRLYIDNSNTTTPLVYGEFDNNRLRVNGTLQVNDPSGTGYQFPPADGTLDQVLQTDGTGNLSWTDPTVNTTAAIKTRPSAHITTYSNSPTENNLIMDTVLFNQGGGAYNTSTGTYTAPFSGVYNVLANLSLNFTSSPSSTIIITFRVYVNGSIVEQKTIQNGATISTSYAQGFTYDFYTNLNAGDLVSFRFIASWNGTTPAPTISGGGGTGTSTISIVKID